MLFRSRDSHPDTHPGDAAAEERFKEVSAAYDVLGDDAKRKEYDEIRRLGPAAARFNEARAISGRSITATPIEKETLRRSITGRRLDTERDPAIAEIAQVIHAGVEYVLHDYRPGTDDRYGQIAVGLLAISEGVLLVNHTDNAIIEASLPVYDAMYANFRAHQLVKARKASIPAAAGRGPTLQTQFLRNLLRTP